MLHLEMVLDLSMRVYSQEQIGLVEDLYAVNRQLVPVFEPGSFEQLLIRNYSKSRVADRIAVEDKQEGILQLCASEGRVTIEQTEVVQEGIQVEGTVEVQILYVTAEDKNPLASVRSMLPFHYLIEVPGMTPDCRFRLEAGLEQMTTVMLDASQVEVKAVVNLNTIVFEQRSMKRLVEVSAEPLDMERLQERPGIIGYIGRNGDRLWDIAKENYTTVAGIQQMNHISKETLTDGDKILIIKSVG